MVLEKSGALEEIYRHALLAYGDLNSPAYDFYGRALERHPWNDVVKQLSEFLVVRDISDRADGVCFRCTLEEPHRWWQRKSIDPTWSLWISTVGPYALLTETPATETEVNRVDVIAVDGDTEDYRGRRIIHTLAAEGIVLLTASDVETTVDFRAYDDRFPVSLFVMLFELDDVPWWHSW